MSFNKDDIKRRMEASVDALKHEFSGLRTGRASSAMLDTITVEVYGSRMPMNQVGSVSVPEPRLLTIQVWDTGSVKAVEKAIRDANLGLNPQADGNLIRVPVPPLTEERRKDLVKVAGQYAESARVSVRNVRRDGMEGLKKMKADGQSEDENKKLSEDVQKMTDESIKKIDALLVEKEKDIMTV
ncbi:MAG: ribosome recycling factor [Micavibrio aeruginosavorus]|uniref:Ribosome-recycling factor n=1 Tax=Micavibrio aeruginosavorus TaxID=349221 RepID=A0A2W5BEG3_9BACT|nr:MAG: ribosome recycling factor [Micavibrio aeruginosavorus]